MIVLALIIALLQCTIAASIFVHIAPDLWTASYYPPVLQLIVTAFGVVCAATAVLLVYVAVRFAGESEVVVVEAEKLRAYFKAANKPVKEPIVADDWEKGLQVGINHMAILALHEIEHECFTISGYQPRRDSRNAIAPGDE
ncbi:hypothetical protein FKG94_03250 [Exilibacterium tricleocarpae]|uniref:Uncharacterized protein n=1 Tax=Exilibacterium tricleocarpae TaxID=2591008 RepID=A0A545U6X4_9GAMM|nr:hypothetical protein [Exilibacterium tricleocarpae]TQV85220.1 hypothetical protein FKG94_03250 [Exilibacterium tricleocarpae]